MPKKNKPKRIIGLDPGIARTGYACLEYSTRETRVIGYGCIETPKTQRYSDRLLSLEKQLISVLVKYKPTVAAMEKLFFYKNVTTAMDVGQARGIILLTLVRRHLIPCEMTPQRIKLAVTGYGNADKKQVQQMMQRLLGLAIIPKPDDAADALAVAYAGATMNATTLSQ